jgi:uncharacterized membrane protein YeiH
MELNAQDLIGGFDRIGIVAFALSGVAVGVRAKLDIFGLLVMGVVTAIGGGMLRDVALGDVPLAMERADYLLWALGSAAFAIVVALSRWDIPRLAVAIADAAGLGAFAVAGALVAMEADLPIPAVLLLAVLTATGGGVMRDLLADRTPMVLRAEVTASAALLGGLLVVLLEPISLELAAAVGVLAAAQFRITSLGYDLHLPIPTASSNRV